MDRARHNLGFTLVELLIVVVIIGLLASIAIPKFSATKDKAQMASMRGDLRNLATAQEAYQAEHAVYYSGTVPSAQLLYSPSPGVEITITEANASGWSAKAVSPMIQGASAACALYVGAAAPVAPATKAGSIMCQN
jgi:prepilin-type N-terminal cleavage/methylation domain-containing protein